MRFVSFCFAATLSASLCTCSGGDDDDPVKDGLSGDLLDVGVKPDVKGVDEPFGRVCENFGQQCKDKDPDGFTLWCVGLQGGTPGKGFCTRRCSDIGPECYNVPNGQWAQCFIEDQSAGDAGPAKKYCGFLCKGKQEEGGNVKTWTCPGTLKCGQPNSQGTAVCIP